MSDNLIEHHRNHRKRTTHGMYGTPEYNSWQHMKSRCQNTASRDYNHYGGRGITVCDRWLNSFENFYADMGPKPTAKHSINRIDNDGNYKPSNCKWSTQTEQCRNQRIRKDNKSGCSGVFRTKKGKYLSSILAEGKRIHIGTFSTLENAARAKKQAEIKYWKEV